MIHEIIEDARNNGKLGKGNSLTQINQMAKKIEDKRLENNKDVKSQAILRR